MGIKCCKPKILEEKDDVLSVLDVSLHPNISSISKKPSPVGKCRDCRKPNTDIYKKIGWCRLCNAARFKNDFYKWSSGNDSVDNFIQESQLNAKSHQDVIEWIPYESIDDVDYIAKGGYGTVFSATWKDGHVTHWNRKNKTWSRSNSITVTVKSIDNSINITGEFFHEIRAYLQSSNFEDRTTIKIYGLTQDPHTQDYMIVTEYANQGNLRSFLVQNHRALNWEKRLRILLNISMSLQDLHQSGFIHKDFHSGNILQNNGQTKISDLGLSRTPYPLDNVLHGVLPYIAPEILRGEEYTTSADIYSLAIVMWEVASGIPPFSNLAHNYDMAISICTGIRPPLLEGTSKSFSTLMEKCWDSDPANRPNINEITGMLFRWYFNLEKRSSDIITTFNEADSRKQPGYGLNRLAVDPAVLKIHPEAYYTSRPLNFIDLPEPTNFFSRVRHDSAFASATRNGYPPFNQNGRIGRQNEHSNYTPLPQVDLEQLRTPSMAISGPIYTALLRKHYRADKIFFNELEREDVDNDTSSHSQAEISEVASTRYSEILATPESEKKPIRYSRYSLALVAELQRRSTPRLIDQLRKGKTREYPETRGIIIPEKQKNRYSVDTVNTLNNVKSSRKNSVNSSRTARPIKFNNYSEYSEQNYINEYNNRLKELQQLHQQQLQDLRFQQQQQQQNIQQQQLQDIQSQQQLQEIQQHQLQEIQQHQLQEIQQHQLQDIQQHQLQDIQQHQLQDIQQNELQDIQQQELQNIQQQELQNIQQQELQNIQQQELQKIQQQELQKIRQQQQDIQLQDIQQQQQQLQSIQVHQQEIQLHQDSVYYDPDEIPGEIDEFDMEDIDVLQYVRRQPTVQQARRLKITSYPSVFITRIRHNPMSSSSSISGTQ